MPDGAARPTVRVVLVSPSDVNAERESLPDIIAELNGGIAEVLGVHLDLWRWEDDAHPGIDPDGPQGVIDRQMAIDGADHVIGVFWHRYGTPTADGLPGTVHELQRAMLAAAASGGTRPTVAIYHRNEPPPVRSAADAEQLTKLLGYLEGLRGTGLIASYGTIEDFRRQIRRDLTALIRGARRDTARLPSSSTAMSDAFPVPRLVDTVDRPDVADDLRKAIETFAVASLEGLPGSGKTYALAHFLRTDESVRSRPVAWIPVRQAASIDDVFADLGTLRAFRTIGAAAKLRELVRWMREIQGLLVIDDVHRIDAEGTQILLDAFLEQGPPCHLIVTSRLMVDRTRYPQLLGRVPMGRLAAEQVASMLQARMLNLSPELQGDLARKTDGLPLAIGLFTSLVQEFDRDPAELLDGRMAGAKRLRAWFDDLWLALEPVEQSLLRFLALSDGPFDRGVLKAAGRFLAADVDQPFERLMQAFLVQPFSKAVWTIHQLLASYVKSVLDGPEQSRIHRAFADWFVEGLSSAEADQEAVFWWRLRAIRHLQLAEAWDRSGPLLLAIAPSAKLFGHYGAFMTLCKAQLSAGAERSGSWITYHLAHCSLILGHAQEALAILDPSRAGTSLAVVRLRAEAMRELGRSREALRVLRSALADARGANDTAIRHARSIEIELLTDLGRYPEARAAGERLLAAEERTRNERGIAVVLARLAVIDLRMAHRSDAREGANRSLALFDRIGDRRGAAWAQGLLVEIDLDDGKPIEPRVVERALTARREIAEADRSYRAFLERLAPLVRGTAPVEALVESERLRVEQAIDGGDGGGSDDQD